jgi:hypothetical protein
MKMRKIHLQGITYNKKLDIIKQKTESGTVNPKIIFEYIAE